jgi:DNA primase
MFPSTDARGNVIGFGARAMRANQQPKYLNTAESDLYQKRRVLFGLDRARAAAARAGRVILVEGYTDVLALHQAGLQNAVGIMGTALTEEQIGELQRVANVLELCLDADRAGQEAMLRAAQLTDRRKLELRVVPLPAGADPAEVIETSGADALRERVARSVPFVKFHVERILERHDTTTAEGRDRAFSELRSALRDLPQNAFGQELLQRVAGALDLTPERLAALVRGARPTNGVGNGVPVARAGEVLIDHALRQEQAFLALCIAMPEAGARTLFGIDVDELITSELMRRVARHLLGRTNAPLSDLPADDEEFARAIAHLVAEAGREPEVSEDQLEHARLVLEQSRLERAIRRAKAHGESGISALAREREEVMAARRSVYARLERAV